MPRDRERYKDMKNGAIGWDNKKNKKSDAICVAFFVAS
jgi:hypothetical protein